MKLTFNYMGFNIEYPETISSEIPFHEARVLGTIVNDMSLMSELEGRGQLFHTKDGMFYYELLNNMYQHKVMEYDAGAVQSALTRLGTEFKAEFVSLNGNGHLNSLRRDFSAKNFESHFDGLLKANAKLKLYKGLYSSLYNLNSGEKVDSDEMLHELECLLDESRDASELSATKPIELTITDKYIEDKVSGVKRGISYGLFSISKATRGMHLGNMSMLSAFGNQGKAQSLDSLLYTKSGYIRMGDVKIGDELFDMDGNITKVTGIFPQGIKDAYEITFKDNSKVISCDEHLWVNNTIDRISRKKNDWKVNTLREIMGRKILTGESYRNVVPVNKPLVLDEKNLSIHPYVLGCLIGDGSIKERAILSSNEQDIVDRVASLLPINHSIKKLKSNNYSYLISNYDDQKDNKIIKNLKSLGLFGLGSHEKFIPQEYMNGSIEQRIDLLRGLFDTDGSVNPKCGNKSISTTSMKLRDDIINLCHTLGYRATYAEDKREYKYGKCYSITISTYDEIFYSEKHKSRVPTNRATKRRTNLLAIKSIEYVGKMEMQCIMVDSPTHTYLTDKMVVTHNTTINYNEVMLDFLDQGEKVFIYSNESAIEDFQDMLLVRTLTKHLKYYNLTRTKLNELDTVKTKDRQMFEEYMVKIAEAKAYIEKTYKGRLILYSVSRYSISEFNMLVRRFAHRGWKYFLIDTMKSEDAGDKQAVGKLVQQSRSIYELARKLNVHVMASYQIASYLKQSMKRVLDESCLSGSKQISEILDILICMREIYPDEYTGQKNEIKVFKLKKDENTGKYYRAYETLETNKKYLVMFLPRTRYGAKILPVVYESRYEFGGVYEVGFAENIQEKSF